MSFTVEGYTITNDERRPAGSAVVIQQGKHRVALSVDQVELFIEHLREVVNEVDPVIAVITPDEPSAALGHVPR